MFLVRKNKVLAVICLFALIIQTFTVTTFASSESNDDEFLSESPFVPVYLSGSYGEFLQNNARTLDDIEGQILSLIHI